MICLSSVATFNSSRRRNLSPKPENGSPASRLFDLTSSMQNKQHPSNFPAFRSKLKLSKTKRGNSFKLKCTSVQKDDQSSAPTEGLANMRVSLNLDRKRFSHPESKSQVTLETLEQIKEIEDIEPKKKDKEDLNDSDFLCLDNLRQSLTKKVLPSLNSPERTSHFSRDSADE